MNEDHTVIRVRGPGCFILIGFAVVLLVLGFLAGRVV